MLRRAVAPMAEGVARRAVVWRIDMADPASDIDLGHVFTEGYPAALAHAEFPSGARPALRTETEDAVSHAAMSTAIILDGDGTAICHHPPDTGDGPWRPIG